MARHTTGKAKVLTDKQQETILKVLSSTRERAMFLLSVKAGLRAVEIAGLQWRHVRDDVLELTKDITKGSKPRSVNIGDRLREALDEHRKASEPCGDTTFLFPNQQMRGYGLSPNAVAQWFRYLYRDRMGWEGYSSHSGRRTYITNAARKVSLAGGSLRDVQSMAGHAHLNTTQVYIEVSTDAKKKLANMV